MNIKSLITIFLFTSLSNAVLLNEKFDERLRDISGYEQPNKNLNHIVDAIYAISNKARLTLEKIKPNLTQDEIRKLEIKIHLLSNYIQFCKEIMFHDSLLDDEKSEKLDCFLANAKLILNEIMSFEAELIDERKKYITEILPTQHNVFVDSKQKIFPSKLFFEGNEIIDEIKNEYRKIMFYFENSTVVISDSYFSEHVEDILRKINKCYIETKEILEKKDIYNERTHEKLKEKLFNIKCLIVNIKQKNTFMFSLFSLSSLESGHEVNIKCKPNQVLFTDLIFMKSQISIQINKIDFLVNNLKDQKLYSCEELQKTLFIYEGFKEYYQNKVSFNMGKLSLQALKYSSQTLKNLKNIYYDLLSISIKINNSEKSIDDKSYVFNQQQFDNTLFTREKMQHTLCFVEDTTRIALEIKKLIPVISEYGEFTDKLSYFYYLKNNFNAVCNIKNDDKYKCDKLVANYHYVFKELFHYFNFVLQSNSFAQHFNKINFDFPNLSISMPKLKEASKKSPPSSKLEELLTQRTKFLDTPKSTVINDPRVVGFDSDSDDVVPKEGEIKKSQKASQQVLQQNVLLEKLIQEKTMQKILQYEAVQEEGRKKVLQEKAVQEEGRKKVLQEKAMQEEATEKALQEEARKEKAKQKLLRKKARKKALQIKATKTILLQKASQKVLQEQEKTRKKASEEESSQKVLQEKAIEEEGRKKLLQEQEEARQEKARKKVLQEQEEARQKKAQEALRQDVLLDEAVKRASLEKKLKKLQDDKLLEEAIKKASQEKARQKVLQEQEKAKQKASQEEAQQKNH